MSFLDRMARRRRLDRLIEQWVEYRDTVTRWAGPADPPPEVERKFLELKAMIAAGLAPLHGPAVPGPAGGEAASHARGMTELMNGQPTLSHGSPGDDFLNRWHAHYLYLHRFREQAPSATGPLAASRAPASMPVASGAGGRTSSRVIRGLFDNWLTRFLVRAAIVAGLVVLVAQVLHVDLRRLPEWGRRVAAGWESSAPATTAVKPAGRPTAPPAAAGDRTIRINAARPAGKHSVDDSGIFQPPPAPEFVPKVKRLLQKAIPGPLRDFLRPVSQRYGVELTVAMFGILMLLLAYMIFGRVR